MGVGSRIAHEAQGRATLGHEGVSIRQERERKGMLQAPGDNDHANRVLLRGIEHVCALGERNGRNADVRLLGAAFAWREQTHHRDETHRN